ncbi:FxSxx-COOH system tetratricopeptide repeat protein [Kitasatospora gansuensis]|uniref:FxSxx-COOH system tetratricopeptide repeat protein n=1 Tax=Kitasatospora gansuensis TaxID=258050 RepID=UPI001615199A
MTRSADGRIVTFYSHQGGTGRTTALANCAWILAANGYRVLAVDWDLEVPGLHRFFRPFVDSGAVENGRGVIGLLSDYRDTARRRHGRPRAEWLRRAACVRGFAHTIDWSGFPQGGRLDLLPAGRADASLGEIVRFFTQPASAEFVDAMREDLSRHYDYVLIDSRSGMSDLADICTLQLPDELLVCFTLSDQSIDAASRIARAIDERFEHLGIRILPVPMRVDEGEKEKADAGRTLARARFDGLPAGLTADELSSYWGSVEIPYRPFYAYEQILATFGDRVGMQSSMLAACERLTGVITRGLVAALPLMNDEVRLRYVEAFRRRRPLPVVLHLSYAPEDRMWAEWIESLLARAGFLVRRRDVTVGPYGSQEVVGAVERTVALLSAAYLRAPQAQALWESMAGADPSGSARGPVPVRIGDVRLTEPFLNRNPVDLVNRDETGAEHVLLRALDVTDAELGEAPSGGPRYPGGEPSVWSVPQRNPFFTGRAKVLEELREQLPGGPVVVLPTPQTLFGLGGVGKTELALEYAHRFKADYDLVWWIDAEQAELIPTGLAELAGQLGLRIGDGVSESARAVLDALRRGEPAPRWLLIFDNAGGQQQIPRFFPGGSGHILVTSRDQSWLGQTDEIVVDVFTRGESVEYLCRRVGGMSRPDADRVAELLCDLPLALEVAAAWPDTTGTPVDSYLQQLQEEATRGFALDRPADYPEPVGATWNVTAARLREQSPAAVRLLQLCAFLAPEPISMDLLFSDRMTRELELHDPTLTEKFMVGKVVQTISRYGLAKVDLSRNSFQMHQLVRAAVRAEMDEYAQMDAMHLAHRILTGARPALGGIDDPANWPKFERIWPHLVPSEAQDCGEADTRELMIDRVRYLWHRDELDQARDLGGSLDAAWTDRHGPDDLQTLLLRVQLANVLRAQGDYTRARALDEAVLERQRELLGEGRPETLMTASALAADFRALGRFQAAQDLDREVLDWFRELFGNDHPHTLLAAGNLAIDLRLAGHAEAARRLDRDTFEHRAVARGANHPHTLAAWSNLARDLRELGDYQGSADLLRQLREELGAVFDPDHPDCLRNATSLAVSLRRAGSLAEAHRITGDTDERYQARSTRDTPDALACALNLAADLRASGHQEAARDRCAVVLDRYRQLLGGEHPFALACTNNLGIYLRANGDIQGAVDHGKQALDGLTRTVGPKHPYTLNAMVNLACAYGELGFFDQAEELERSAHAGLCELYGPGHPDALACQVNLAVTLRDHGRLNEAGGLRSEVLVELVQRLGEEHPLTVAARGWRRISRDLEPQPI